MSRHAPAHSPCGIAILAVVGAAFVALPLLALLIRAPWGDLVDVAHAASAPRTALRLSLEVSLAATALSLLLGVPARVGPGARDVPGPVGAARDRRSCRSCCRRWSAGSDCSTRSGAAGSSGGGSTTASASSSRSPSGARSSPPRSCRCRSSCWPRRRACARSTSATRGAAATLGRARRATRCAAWCCRCCVPQLAAGAVLAWARALGEFGATITFAGNLAGPDADAAARRLPGAADRPRRRDLPVAAPGGALGRGAGRDARSPHAGAMTPRGRPRACTRGAFDGRGGRARGGRRRDRSRSSVPTAPASPRVVDALAGLVGRPRAPRSSSTANAIDRARRPSDAGVGVCFQDDLLFPHLSALENVAFPLRARRHAQGGARSARRASCSRGSRPAVRPGREARASSPAASGSASRWRARSPPSRGCCCWTSPSPPSTSPRARGAPVARCARSLDGFDGVSVLVAHDPLDALTLADRVACWRTAGVTQAGTPEEIRERAAIAVRRRPGGREPVRRARSSRSRRRGARSYRRRRGHGRARPRRRAGARGVRHACARPTCRSTWRRPRDRLATSFRGPRGRDRDRRRPRAGPAGHPAAVGRRGHRRVGRRGWAWRGRPTSGPASRPWRSRCMS